MRFHWLLFISLVSYGYCAPVAEHKHSIQKRQLTSPTLGVGLGAGMGALLDTYDFLRPSTGLWAGPLGGYQGSMIFGPPFMGPFNNPNARLQRIINIFDTNRLNHRLGPNDYGPRPTMRDQFRLDGNFY